MRWRGNRRSDNIEDQRHVQHFSLGGMGRGGGIINQKNEKKEGSQVRKGSQNKKTNKTTKTKEMRK